MHGESAVFWNLVDEWMQYVKLVIYFDRSLTIGGVIMKDFIELILQ